MDFLQNLDPAHMPYIAVGCALLCVTALVIGFVLQALSGFFDVIAGLLGIAVEILQGGPPAWIGCALLVLGLIGGIGLIALLLHAPNSCAAYPTNFCRWFGFIP